MVEMVQRGFVTPQTDADSEWWWEGLSAEKLLLPRCSACGKWRFPPTPTCPYCGDTSFERLEASGEGTVYSWVTVHLPLDPAFSDDTPYTVLGVTLREGPRIFGRLVGADAVPAAGAEVAAAFYRVQSTVLLGFRLV